MKEQLAQAKREIAGILADKVIPFWLERAVDDVYGGYLTSFDEQGNFDGNGVKYMVTQSGCSGAFLILRPLPGRRTGPK